MRIRTLSAVLLAVVLPISSCSEKGLLDPAGAPTPLFNHAENIPPDIRISEIHYDDAGTDANEAIEISGPAGASVAGWTIVLYNGSGGAAYNTQTLAGTIPATPDCGTRGVVQQLYPVNGIQNGGPDGIALVNAAGHVVEFLSYEGTFTAVGGPANGMASIQIPVNENGGEPDGQSIKRRGSGANVWEAPAASNFGACNDNDASGPPIIVDPPSSVPSVRFSEIHYDNNSTDVGEAIEVEGPAGTDVTGWTIVLYNGSGGTAYGTKVLDGLIPAGEACGGRGVVYATYPSNGIQNGSPDGFALVDAAGAVVEFLSYEGVFVATGGPAAGMSSADIGASQPASSSIGQSLQRDPAGAAWSSGTSSFGACNAVGATPPPVGNSISFSGRTPSDPALPVGFEDQLFATMRNGSGTIVETEFTWASETPAIASIDQNGVMRALSAGTAVLRATAEDGTSRTYSLPTHVATASASADYEGNAEFGEPSDATPADELIIRRNQLITSFNPTKGTPNWVAYEIDASHFGAQDRCDCFTYDPELPDAGTYTTADYTGAGAFHGYAIDRGHLARSFDRTAGSLDNAFTYYFSNIIPQAADNNQGPWAQLENYLGNLAQSGAKEVYVIAGPQGDKGTIKNENMIVIPENTWKVAVIMPKDQGIESVNSYDDVEVIAVIMPNVAGIRSVPWETYKRTVDEVEALTGYDLLALLRDDIEIAVESDTRPPVAAMDGPYTGIEGESIDMSAAMSSDADGDALTFAWRFGDGGSASGMNVSHTYTSGGTFTVRLIATDTRALSDTVETTAAIATWSQATGSAGAMVGQLADAGKINHGIANSLQAKLSAAENQFQRGNTTAAVNQLEAFIHELDALVQSGRLSSADAAQLRTLVTRIIQAAS